MLSRGQWPGCLQLAAGWCRTGGHFGVVLPGGARVRAPDARGASPGTVGSLAHLRHQGEDIAACSAARLRLHSPSAVDNSQGGPARRCRRQRKAAARL